MKPALKDDPNGLSPADRREQAIAHTCATLFRSLIAEQINRIEADAAASAEDSADDPDAGPVMARVAFAIEWEAGAQAPQIGGKLSYTVRRKFTGEMLCDPAQMKLEGVQ